MNVAIATDRGRITRGREFTGNHYIAAPSISPVDGSIHSLNVLHRAAGGLLSWSAQRDLPASGEPLLSITLSVDGAALPLGPLRWERLDRWIPRWRAEPAPDLVVTGTLVFPGGFEPLIRGGLLLVDVHNRARSERSVEVVLEGRWRFGLLTLATTRPLAGRNRLVRGVLHGGVALELGPGGPAAALAISAGGEATYCVGADDANDAIDSSAEQVAEQGELIRFQVARTLRLRTGKQSHAAFYLGVAPERDGALATTEHLGSIGPDELLRLGRLDVTRLSRRARDASLTGMLNRNLLFAHYGGVARAIDDDRLYFVRSRAPAHGACAVFNEREALLWLLPALTLTDPLLAREALMRAFEQYSHRPGERSRYLDGTVLSPGLCLDQLCAYALALDRYVTESSDPSMLDEPLVQDVLREIDENLFNRLDREYFLCATEFLPSGERADYPFLAYDNALVWRYSDALPRIWRRRDNEPPPRFERAGEELAAALWQRCTTEVDGMRVIGYASDLRGGIAIYDDPAGSLRLLPHLGFCGTDDPIWSNTMDLLHSPVYPLWHGQRAYPGFAGRSRPDRASVASLCSDLLTPRRDDAVRVLKQLQLEAGIACESFDPDTGHAAAGPFAAALAGFLAWALIAEGSVPTTSRTRARQTA